MSACAHTERFRIAAFRCPTSRISGRTHRLSSRYRIIARRCCLRKRLNPACGQPVDKLLTNWLVFFPQRAENKHWCGFQRSRFAYNELPTSSCHIFCWKARHLFDAPFFWCRRADRSGRRMTGVCKDLSVVAKPVMRVVNACCGARRPSH